MYKDETTSEVTENEVHPFYDTFAKLRLISSRTRGWWLNIHNSRMSEFTLVHYSSWGSKISVGFWDIYFADLNEAISEDRHLDCRLPF